MDRFRIGRCGGVVVVATPASISAEMLAQLARARSETLHAAAVDRLTGAVPRATLRISRTGPVGPMVV
jgi:RecA/RadA recombinase